MKTILKTFVSLLLLFNSIGVIYGALNLIIYPDGNSIQMSLDYLEHSPFNNYLIPGIILFVANGLFSLFVLIAVLSNLKNYSLLIITQGCILTGWIEIQIIMIRSFIYLHAVFGSAGVLLILIGWIISKTEHSKAEETKTGIKIAG